ncbi:MAG: hypothetical protein ACP5C3_03595 [Methanomicrobiales archaeon]
MNDERIQIITKLSKYKSHLQNKEDELLRKLLKYYNRDDSILEKHGVYHVKKDLKNVKNVNYSNPLEAYLISQIKICEKVPPILSKYISLLENGNDIDHTLESFELEVYKIKKEIYAGMDEWKAVIDHIPDYRLFEIEINPKGPGDHLINELLWLKDYEERFKKIELK